MPRKLVAIVTARGGSKRLPRKNVLPLAGVPLVLHTLRAARGAASVSLCAVTTEDEEIEALARAEGATVIRRPPELATDDASSVDTVLHALDALRALGEDPEDFVLLQPTSPLRTVAHIDEAAALFFGLAQGSVLGVTTVEHHPGRMLAVNDDGTLRPLLGADLAQLPRQSLFEVVRPNGALYIARTADFRQQCSFLVPPVRPYRMSREASIDIDSALDFRLAELVLSQRR